MDVLLESQFCLEKWRKLAVPCIQSTGFASDFCKNIFLANKQISWQADHFPPLLTLLDQLEENTYYLTT